MMAFMSDVLAMGQSKYGSFSLADSKTSLLAMSVDILLKQIKNVINRDLVAQTYALNMWDDEEHVQITYDDIETPDLEAIGSYIQKTVAVGALKLTKSYLTNLESILVFLLLMSLNQYLKNFLRIVKVVQEMVIRPLEKVLQRHLQRKTQAQQIRQINNG